MTVLKEEWLKFLGEAKRKDWDSSHICLMKGTKVLLVQRAEDDHWMPLKWRFAGGEIDKGENPETALVREVAEEVGLEIQLADLHYLPAISYKLKHAFCCCRKMKGKLNINANGMKEHEEGKWVEIEDIVDYDTAPDVKAVVGESLEVMKI